MFQNLWGGGGDIAANRQKTHEIETAGGGKVGEVGLSLVQFLGILKGTKDIGKAKTCVVSKKIPKTVTETNTEFFAVIERRILMMMRASSI